MVLKLHPRTILFRTVCLALAHAVQVKMFRNRIEICVSWGLPLFILVELIWTLCYSGSGIHCTCTKQIPPSPPPDSSKRTWPAGGTVSESVSIILGPYQKNRWRGNDKFPPLECTIFVCFLFTVANWVVVIICFGMSVEVHRVCNGIEIVVFSCYLCELSGGSYLLWYARRSA